MLFDGLLHQNGFLLTAGERKRQCKITLGEPGSHPLIPLIARRTVDWRWTAALKKQTEEAEELDRLIWADPGCSGGMLLKGREMAIGKRKRIGLALGGGGSRGFAHIGVLKVFEEKSIPVDVIAGTSIGALVGGAYASGLGPEELVKKVEGIAESRLSKLPVFKAIEGASEQKEWRLVDKMGLLFKSQWLFAQALFHQGMLEEKDFQSVIDHFIPDIMIEETKIPFRAVAADLTDGREAVLSRGSLRRAVMASCAVPGFMPPVRQGGMLLVDRGAVNMMPCSVARQWGAEVVIGVDVDRDIGASRDFKNAIDVYTRAAEIGGFHLSHLCRKEADVVIKPRVGGMKWFDLSHAVDVIGEGERCARESMGRIRKLIPARREGKFFRALVNLLGRKA